MVIVPLILLLGVGSMDLNRFFLYKLIADTCIVSSFAMAFAHTRASHDPNYAMAFHNSMIALPSLTLATNVAATFLVLFRILCAFPICVYLMRTCLMSVCQHAPCRREKSGAFRRSRWPRWQFHHRQRRDALPSPAEGPHRIGWNVLPNVADSALPQRFRVQCLARLLQHHRTANGAPPTSPPPIGTAADPRMLFYLPGAAGNIPDADHRARVTEPGPGPRSGTRDRHGVKVCFKQCTTIHMYSRSQFLPSTHHRLERRRF